MAWKNRGGAESNSRNLVSRKMTIVLCVGCFFAGILFTDRMWTEPEAKGISKPTGIEAEKLNLLADGCDTSSKDARRDSKDIIGEVSKTRDVIQTLDKTISNLEMELAAARAMQDSIVSGTPKSDDLRLPEPVKKRKYLMVIGINTAFSSRRRRDSVRATWMPQGDNLKKLEEEKGIVMRFVIGHSATSGGILDRAIEAEEKKHGDFLRLEHIEGYLELSAKTKTYFTTAVALWDADFYVKVDDDVHVNIGTLGATLSRYRLRPRVYVGCMKSGPVLAHKGVRYHEPEHWKFGEEGNKYFRHATGQLYVISKDLATYISINHSCVFHLIWSILNVSDTYYTNTQTRTFHWDHGLSDWMSSTLMIGGCAVAHHQIASGRLKQGTYVWLHLIGVAVGFAGLLIGLRMFTRDVGKTNLHCGMHLFKKEQNRIFLTLCLYICKNIERYVEEDKGCRHRGSALF